MALLISLLGIGFGEALSSTWRRLHAQDGELGTAVPVARKVVEREAVLVARKQHLGFYAGRHGLYFPEAESLEELREELRSRWTGGPMYLYFGPVERRRRSALSVLASADQVPSWLELAARGGPPQRWLLYRVSTAHWGGSVGPILVGED